MGSLPHLSVLNRLTLSCCDLMSVQTRLGEFPFPFDQYQIVSQFVSQGCLYAGTTDYWGNSPLIQGAYLVSLVSHTVTNHASDQRQVSCRHVTRTRQHRRGDCTSIGAVVFGGQAVTSQGRCVFDAFGLHLASEKGSAQEIVVMMTSED